MELVVGASTATMKSVLSKLGSLLAQEYALIRGVRGDIQYINDELASMQAFLLDIAQDGQDNRRKHWMKQIRDMAYDCEDCIDDFAHRLRNDSNLDEKCCSWIVTIIYELWTFRPRREIASNIAGLKVRAQQIAERRDRYGADNPITTNGNDLYGASDATYDIAEHQLPRRQIVDEKEPVGVKECMDNLEKWILGNAEHRAVLSIVGFGGMGKTTIAKALYRKVINEFHYRAWITVSQNYDEAAVLRDILNQVNPQNTDQKQQSSSTGSIEKTKIATHIRRTLERAVQLSRCCGQQGNDGSSNVKDIKDLSEKLTDYLKDKRYIILVDDLWSTETWKRILRSLPAGKKGSRVIVTSRFQAVGAACSETDRDHVESIDFLKPDYSKELFDASVIESKSSKHSDNVVNQVREHLWKRCGGLPLAVVTMAGLVNCNRQKPRCYWDKLCKSLPEQENSLTLDGVTRILDYCYNDLRGDLKTCLLYLSIFPKGWKVSRKCLTRRWIAEGFVSEKQGLAVEEVAEAYFNQLLRRNLIRPVEHSSNGKLKTFQVHDMVLEYVVSKAREENFITVVGGHWMVSAPSYKVRRLSMQSSDSKHGDSTKGMNLSQVRSLTIFGRQTQLSFQAFNKRLIQVLDLDGWKGLQDKHLTEICKMLVLKYLSLRRTDIKRIPPKIGNLEFLEILDIRETKVEKLPREVFELKLINSILGGSKNPRKGLRLPQEKNKNTRKNMKPDDEDTGGKGLRLPQEKNKNTRKNMKPDDEETGEKISAHKKSKDGMKGEKISAHKKSKDGMKGLRILSGIEIVGESTEIASLHEMTGLRKLAIYNLSVKKGDKAFNDLQSAIAYLSICGLQTLAINDESSDFINSLDNITTPPRYLIALELSGKLERPPQWIPKLEKLNKLTLSTTVFSTDTLGLLVKLPLLFSLTFFLNPEKKDKDKDKKIQDILEKNKSESGGEIIVPLILEDNKSDSGGQIIDPVAKPGFPSLKLLRFISPHVPKVGFSDNAMPLLEMIEMQFETFEGLFGIETLKNLREVHLRLPAPAPDKTKLNDHAAEIDKNDQAAVITKLLVDDLKSTDLEFKVIVDHFVRH